MVQRLFAIMQIFAVVLFIMSTGEAAKTVVTDNLNYAGFRADCVPGDDFSLMAKHNILLYTEPQDDSKIAGEILPNEDLMIKDAKVIVHPDLGRAKVVAPPTMTYGIPGQTPQIGDEISIVYMIAGKYYQSCLALDNGDFVYLYWREVFIPETKNNQSVKNDTGSGEDEIFVPQTIEYFGRVYDKKIFFDFGKNSDNPLVCRNADVWVKLELPDKTEGWVQIWRANAGLEQKEKLFDDWYYKNDNMQHVNLMQYFY